MRGIVAIVVIASIVHMSCSFVYPDDCSLARALLAEGFPKNLLPDWVCLINAESRKNTGAKGGPNSNGSFDYGLFQINSRFWCKIGAVGGACNADCNNFIDNNIADDAKCAQAIFKCHGFNAWCAWKANCQANKPNLADCNL